MADKFFTDGDLAWIDRDTREQFSDKDRMEDKISKMEKINEKKLQECLTNLK